MFRLVSGSQVLGSVQHAVRTVFHSRTARCVVITGLILATLRFLYSRYSQKPKDGSSNNSSTTEKEPRDYTLAREMTSPEANLSTTSTTTATTTTTINPSSPDSRPIDSELFPTPLKFQETSTEHFTTQSTSVVLCLSGFPNESEYPEDKYQKTHPNKVFAYNHLSLGLTQKQQSEAIAIEKVTLKNPNAVLQMFPFKNNRPKITIEEDKGGFRFPASDDFTIHWVSDFADPNVVKFVQCQNCAQEEIVALQHPQFYHLVPTFKYQMDFLNIADGSTLLFKGIWKLADFNPTNTKSNLKTIYGNNFKEATQDDIKSCLTPLQNPTKSYIMAFAAPPFIPQKQNQPYSLEDLQGMFLKAYTAFQAAKGAAESQGKTVVLHLGNWGTGVSGIDPFISHTLQLVAAQLAGIDEIHFYPMDFVDKLQEAIENINRFNGFTSADVRYFLEDTVDRAAAKKLRFKATNKT